MERTFKMDIGGKLMTEIATYLKMLMIMVMWLLNSLICQNSLVMTLETY